MTSVTASAEFFFRSLGWGLILFSLLPDDQETGPGLKKLVAGISLGTSILGFLLYGVHAELWSVPGACYLLGIVSAFLMLLIFHNSRLLYAAYVSAMTLLFVLISSSAKEALFSLSSAAFLGIIAYAMILGHWYLVTPRLSKAPLLRSFALLGGLMAIKLLLVGTSFLTGISIPDTFGQILIAMRIIWGYVAVGAMGYFGYRLVRMGSIQSATGILYAMTFAVFIGELGSHYLRHHYGVWL